ncbi:MAG: hypothetical protein A2007_03540 [Verrucomicrobia bacterium GWC2_42_7]|nr:MAG: hypothetical protein A2007_03540 [Verrucomicrobia bacterium GWC2_42_7]
MKKKGAPASSIKLTLLHTVLRERKNFLKMAPGQCGPCRKGGADGDFSWRTERGPRTTET